MYYKESTRDHWSTVQNVTHLNSQNEWEPLPLSSKVKVGTPPQNSIMINNKTVFIIGNGESRREIDLAELNQYGKTYGCNALYRDYTPDALIAVDHRMAHQIYWTGYSIDNVCYFRDWNRMPADSYQMLLDPQMITTKGSDYEVYTNDRQPHHKEFVMHGANKDELEKAEQQIKELDPDKALTKDAVKALVGGDCLQPGFYISWVEEIDKVHSTTEPGLIPGDSDGGFSSGTLAHLISIAVEEPDEVYFIGMDLYSNYNDRYNNLYKGTEGYMGEGGNAIPPDNWIAQHGMVMEQFSNVQHYKVNKLPLGSDTVNQEIEEWKVLQNLEYLTYADLFGKLADR